MLTVNWLVSPSPGVACSPFFVSMLTGWDESLVVCFGSSESDDLTVKLGSTTDDHVDVDDCLFTALNCTSILLPKLSMSSGVPRDAMFCVCSDPTASLASCADPPFAAGPTGGGPGGSLTSATLGCSTSGSAAGCTGGGAGG